jgi:hypothetical protein
LSIANIGRREFSVIEGQENLKSNMTHFYKGLFGEPEQCSISLESDRTDDITQVIEVENAILMAPFSEEEVKAAIFQMEHNKAPGPNDFTADFYKKFWVIIKGDLMTMFQELHSGDSPLFSLNFRVISLTPITQELNHIQQYRPICLLNVSYKIFTKVAKKHN